MVIPREALPALLALERLFSRVGSLVILEDVLVAERPVTDGAAKDLTAVHAHVSAIAALEAVGSSCWSHHG